jgi:hypothetical protein
VFRGSGIEFDEVREFTEGDDIRAVDWNVTARTGRPHVKKYMEERELTVLFLMDVSGSMAFGAHRVPLAGIVETPRLLQRDHDPERRGVHVLIRSIIHQSFHSASTSCYASSKDTFTISFT